MPHVKILEKLKKSKVFCLVNSLRARISSFSFSFSFSEERRSMDHDQGAWTTIKRESRHAAHKAEALPGADKDKIFERF